MLHCMGQGGHLTSISSMPSAVAWRCPTTLGRGFSLLSMFKTPRTGIWLQTQQLPVASTGFRNPLQGRC